MHVALCMLRCACCVVHVELCLVVLGLSWGCVVVELWFSQKLEVGKKVQKRP